MTKAQRAQKLQKLDLLVQVECIDYSPSIKGYVTGETIIDAPDLPSLHGRICCSLFSGYTAQEVSNFAQIKFGFGINF
jgi:hypothetical protein